MSQSFTIVPGFLFEEAELSAPGQEIRVAAERIKVRIDNRRNSLLQMINRILRGDVWARAFADWQAMENAFGSTLQSSWNTAYGSSDRAQLLNTLREQEKRLLDFENKHRDAMVLAEHGLATQAAAQFAADAVFNRISTRLQACFDEIKSISTKLVETRTALDATQSFRKHLETLRDKALADENSARWWILGTLLLALALEAAAVLAAHRIDLAAGESIALKVAIAAATVFLLYFQHNQYKLAAAMRIKYVHLAGLIDGGATDLIAVLAEHQEFRTRILEKMADAFMSTEDITGALLSTKTPTEDVLQVVKALGQRS